MRHLMLTVCVLFSTLALGACSSSNDPPPPPPTYTVGGTVSGLTGTGLVLQLNGGSDLTVDADGSFTFPGGLTSGTAYDVTVLTSPTGETCTVSAGDGTIGTANVTNVVVTCATTTFTIGGTVAGFVDGSLTLSLNGNEDLVLTANGAYTFVTAVADGSPYSVTIKSSPAFTNCTITNATGTVAGANVTDIQVDCIRTYAIGGQVFGATAGLILDLNSGDESLLLFAATEQTFTFNTRLPSGATYAVIVSTEPFPQTCTVKDGTGTVAAADVTGIEIYCTGPAQGLYTSDTSPASIYNRVTLSDGTVQAISQNINFDQVGGLAYNLSASLFYGLDSATDRLLAINSVTGSAATMGSQGVGISDVNGLAYDDTNGVLYGVAAAVAATMGQLITIDTSTGVGTAVGTGFATGSGQALGLAYDDANTVLYASTDDGSVYTVDPLTGASSTSVTVTGLPAISGLGFDQGTNTLYGLLDGQTVATIDVGTGVPTTVGAVDGFQSVDGFAYAGGLDNLYGTDTSLTATSVLLSINKTDASAETVGSTGWPLTGMGQDPTDDIAYGITSDSHLLRINQDTGETTYITQVAIPGGLETQCLAFNDVTATLFTFAVDPSGDDTLLELGIDGSIITNHGVVTVDGGDWKALTFSINGLDRKMYGVYQSVGLQDDQLYEVGETGVVTLQFALDQIPECQAIAYEHNGTSARFFGVDTSNNRLFQVRLNTGEVTILGLTPKSFGAIWVP